MTEIEEIKKDINAESASISKILKETDIVDVITENGVELKKEGVFYRGACPFHKDHANGFIVDREAGQYQCLECDRGGNAISFLMIAKSISFDEAAKMLAERLGKTFEENRNNGKALRDKILDANRDACVFWMQQLHESEEAMKYLSSRGITLATAVNYGLGFAKGDNLRKHMKSKGYSDEELLAAGLIKFSEEKQRYYETFFNRIVMPITNEQGEVLAFSGRKIPASKEKTETETSVAKYLNTPNTLVFKKAENIFGIAQACASNKPYVLVEGNFDVISLRQAGIKTAIAALGTALTPRQIDLIATHNNSVYVGYDNDAAGKKAALKSIQMLLKFGCCVKVVSPAPYKDFDEVCQHESVEEIQQRFKIAEDGISYLIRSFVEEGDYDSVADLLLI